MQLMEYVHYYELKGMIDRFFKMLNHFYFFALH
jgi:hypothetical protein